VFYDVNFHCWRPNDNLVVWLLAFTIGAIGNFDLFANIKSYHHTKQTFLANLVAANTLAIICLPVHYFNQLSIGCGLGIPMRMAFWISRDLAAAVQIFSVVVLSVVRFQNLRSHGNYVSLPTYALEDHSTETSAVRNNSTADRSTSDVPLFTVWTAAVCYSVPAAVVSNALCYLHPTDMYEDTITRHVAITHSLAFRLIPLCCAVLLHILTEFKRRNGAHMIQSVDDNGKMLSWLLATVFINYVPLHCWILYSWSQDALLTRAAVDVAMYFPLYSTASCIPVVVYFTMATRKLGVIQTV
jgi:hypothetical protein